MKFNIVHAKSVKHDIVKGEITLTFTASSDVETMNLAEELGVYADKEAGSLTLEVFPRQMQMKLPEADSGPVYGCMADVPKRVLDLPASVDPEPGETIEMPNFGLPIQDADEPGSPDDTGRQVQEGDEEISAQNPYLGNSATIDELITQQATGITPGNPEDYDNANSASDLTPEQLEELRAQNAKDELPF